MNEKPLVSIGIPTYARLEYLKEALGSALGQEYPKIEVMISDDGRDESIFEWSKSLDDSRVRYWRNPTNQGLAGNWNILASAAFGEYLVIIGDDDRLRPGFVSRMICELRNDIDVIFSNHFVIDEHGLILTGRGEEMTRNYHRDIIQSGEIDEPECCVWRNSIPMSATLIRVSKARQFGFMNTLNTPELEFFARLAAGGGRFQFVPDYLSEYRVHSQSETSRGLRSEDLADCLEGLKAKAAAEPFKRAFMGPLLINSVSRCLQRGDRDRARHFLASKYYPEPRWKSPSTIIQTVCAGLPASMGCRLYRVIARVKAGRRSA